MTFHIPSSWLVLVLEDSEEPIAWFRERSPQATFARCAKDALKALRANSYRAIFLDHDLHWLRGADNSIVKGTGKEIALALAKSEFDGIVVIHCKNEAGASVMAQASASRQARPVWRVRDHLLALNRHRKQRATV
jgi:hypothetical protein